MLKKHPVVMLPTNKKAPLILRKGYIETPSYVKPKLQLATKFDEDANYQHLYFLSDEEIKEGDWKYCGYHDEVLQHKKGTIDGETICAKCKKIIAATDSSLGIVLDDSTFPSSKVRDYYLPQPSAPFLQKYAEKYNKGEQIDEVMIDYLPTVPLLSLGDTENYKLHVNPKDNTITIKPVKDSWNREEVEELLRNSIREAISYPEQFVTGICLDSSKVKKWIEENL